MDSEWTSGQPIYRQIRERVVAMILEGSLPEGEPLPSVRSVASDLRVNPLTVLKAYQQLSEDGLVEKRRGVGMFVRNGARKVLLASERERFLQEHWPAIAATIERLGLTRQLLHGAAGRPEVAHERD